MAESSGDEESQRVLTDAGFRANSILWCWFNPKTGRAIPFKSVREHDATWVAAWIADAPARG